VAQSPSDRFTQSGVNNEINVVPMIDVMLVLLVIFMIVTPIITTGFQATIPQSLNPESRPEEDEDILLGIDRDGGFYLQQRPIREEDLHIALEALYVNRVRDKILYLKADKDIHFGRVQDAIEIARESGVRVIGTVTDRRQELFVRGEH
jgi:biopolymer transport protein ExbD